MPRALRREIGPLPALAELIAGELRPFSGPLLPQLARAVSAATGARVEEEAFRLDAIPHYLRLSCRVVGERGKVIAQSRDVSALIREHAPEARQAFVRESTPPSWERAGLTRWDFGAIPEFVTRPVLGAKVRAYPAIVDRQKAVDLTLLESREAADSATRAGVRRLLMLGSQRALAVFAKRVPPAFPRTDRMPPSRAESDAFRDRVLLRVVEEAFELRTAPLPRDAAAFEALLAAGQRRVDAVFERVSRAVVAIAAELDKTQRALSASARQPSGTNAARDITAQLELLMRPELVDQIELERLEHYPRYLRAAQTRLSRAITDPRKDADKLAPLVPLYNAYLEKQKRARDPAAARNIYFDFEELRVAIFAPELKPAYPVSAVAIARSLETLR